MHIQPDSDATERSRRELASCRRSFSVGRLQQLWARKSCCAPWRNWCAVARATEVISAGRRAPVERPAFELAENYNSATSPVPAAARRRAGCLTAPPTSSPCPATTSPSAQAMEAQAAGTPSARVGGLPIAVADGDGGPGRRARPCIERTLDRFSTTPSLEMSALLPRRNSRGNTPSTSLSVYDRALTGIDDDDCNAKPKDALTGRRNDGATNRGLAARPRSWAHGVEHKTAGVVVPGTRKTQDRGARRKPFPRIELRVPVGENHAGVHEWLLQHQHHLFGIAYTVDAGRHLSGGPVTAVAGERPRSPARGWGLRRGLQQDPRSEFASSTRKMEWRVDRGESPI